MEAARPAARLEEEIAMRRQRPRLTIVALGLVVVTGLTLAACASPAPATGDGSRASDDPAVTATASPTPSDGRRSVEVVAVATMGSDDVLAAGGYVHGVIEAGGTCAFTLVQGDATVDGSSSAEPDATTTWCSNVNLTLPTPGAPWTLKLRYESPASVGAGSVTSTGEIS
ncbi:hypothetical protein [Xylanimonas sp. McL0601]|uniref:hypothetical protein n=1 Tax=Xylanimonas sp. McL0601 TaxID=3414739 RepID=UPI003CEBE626